ncbi:hypothetical protein [Paracoccus sp. (in: a-proteobacteria)]|uniref:hypothetical protein n=1 Tax=Paracoccus sp. TaxID=267 RepID=UPI00396D053C
MAARNVSKAQAKELSTSAQAAQLAAALSEQFEAVAGNRRAILLEGQNLQIFTLDNTANPFGMMADKKTDSLRTNS